MRYRQICASLLCLLHDVLPPSFYSYVIHGYNSRNVFSEFVRIHTTLLDSGALLYHMKLYKNM